ncbi:hypothetical protein Hanom_Chr14g01253691 [Helianthus anomalus]
MKLTSNFGLEISLCNLCALCTFGLEELKFIFIIKSKLQVLFFMFVSNFRRCPLPLKLMCFVFNVSKSCTLCPLGQTQLIFCVKTDHVQGT